MFAELVLKIYRFLKQVSQINVQYNTCSQNLFEIAIDFLNKFYKAKCNTIYSRNKLIRQYVPNSDSGGSLRVVSEPSRYHLLPKPIPTNEVMK
jgi:hypothetical protein